jgi:hypothetical protein
MIEQDSRLALGLAYIQARLSKSESEYGGNPCTEHCSSQGTPQQMPLTSLSEESRQMTQVSLTLSPNGFRASSGNSGPPNPASRSTWKPIVVSGTGIATQAEKSPSRPTLSEGSCAQSMGGNGSTASWMDVRKNGGAKSKTPPPCLHNSESSAADYYDQAMALLISELQRRLIQTDLCGNSD